MTYIFDLDGTLLTEGGYASARPKQERIKHLRRLYEEGHTIVIQTARNKAYEKMTKRQLKDFEIPYHVICVGSKIFGDVYIDDKGINADDFFK